MMTLTRSIPKFRFHKASGQYLVALPNGDGKPKYLYLGKNLEAAEARYEAEIAKLPTENGHEPRKGAPVLFAAVSVAQAAEALIEYVCAEKPSTAKERRRLNGQCLRLFVEKHGNRSIADISTDDLESLRSELSATLAPKTCNHYLGTVKRLMKYAAYKGWREPMELSFIRRLPVPAPKPKHFKTDELSKMLSMAEAKTYRSDDDNAMQPLYNSLRIQLLGALRPSEVVRLLLREFEEVEKGVYMLHKGKTDDSASMRRFVLLPKLGQQLLKATTVNYAEPRAYLFQTKRATKRTPHRLRHTGAYLLHRMPERATREEVDIILGHYPNRVSATYNPLHWDEYMPIMERYAQHLKCQLPKHF